MKQEKNYKTKRNSIRKRAKINNNNIKNNNSKNTSKEDKNNKIYYWMERNSKQILQRNKHQMALLLTSFSSYAQRRETVAC